MELGQRIKAVRLEKGMSQRQLCGEMITRNMLSQIESGRAKPSMTTLSYLATQLERPVSYFLSEDAVTSPNQALMVSARAAYAAGDVEKAIQLLEDFRQPDECFEEERALLLYLSYLAMAERALHEQRMPYAVSLLEKASLLEGMYLTEALCAKAQVLSAMTGKAELPDIDPVLQLKAQRALDAGDGRQAAAFLDSCKDQCSNQWRLLRGWAAVLCGEYAQASAWLLPVQVKQAYALLEICCRETGDFKGAYEYACKQRM